MRTATVLFATALISATLVTFTQFASAADTVPNPYGPLPVTLEGALHPVKNEGTAVAGITKQENPQPKTRALLTKDANRNIRWQPWEYRSAFSASVLEQLQAAIDRGELPLGNVSIYENETVFEGVKKGAEKGIKELSEALNSGELDLSKGKVFKLAVYTYRHNYADTGLFQLYVSGTAKFEGGFPGTPGTPGQEFPFKDIQGLQYEFEDPDYTEGKSGKPSDYNTQLITFWRGVVVRVDAEGKVKSVAGSIAGVNAGAFVEKTENGKKVITWEKANVKDMPFANWELASVLKRTAYDPDKGEDRPEYVHPFDRLTPVPKGTVDGTYVDKISKKDLPTPNPDEVKKEEVVIVEKVVTPSVKPRPASYQYNGPRGPYSRSRLLLGNGR